MSGHGEEVDGGKAESSVHLLHWDPTSLPARLSDEISSSIYTLLTLSLEPNEFLINLVAGSGYVVRVLLLNSYCFSTRPHAVFLSCTVLDKVMPELLEAVLSKDSWVLVFHCGASHDEQWKNWWYSASQFFELFGDIFVPMGPEARQKASNRSDRLVFEQHAPQEQVVLHFFALKNSNIDLFPLKPELPG